MRLFKHNWLRPLPMVLLGAFPFYESSADENPMY